MHVIIFAGGTVQEGVAVERALVEGELVIAADSGAETALILGDVPAFVVGDFASLAPDSREELELLCSRFVLASVEKDETDTELAIEVALQQGASQITLLGALGGERFEHSIANILLLAGYETISIQLVDGNSRSWLFRGPGDCLIEGKEGDLVSLFPLTGSAENVRTENLYYPLRGEQLLFGKPRGISNIFTQSQVRIVFDEGLLLVVHTISS